jgi:hypothetical protein
LAVAGFFDASAFSSLASGIGFPGFVPGCLLVAFAIQFFGNGQILHAIHVLADMANVRRYVKVAPGVETMATRLKYEI